MTWNPDDRRPKRKERCLWKGHKIATFLYFGTKSVDFFAQLSVLASCPASTSSWDRPQTKQRLSKWCGVELRVSLATRRNSKYIKNQAFYRDPKMSLGYFTQQTLSLVTCQVTEKFTGAIVHCSSSDNGAIKAFDRSIDFDHPRCRLSSIAPRVFTESCYVRMKSSKLSLNVYKKRFWKYKSGRSCFGVWSSLSVCSSFPRSAELQFSGRLRLKMQKIHRVNLVRLNLLKSREIIERHWICPRRKPARSVWCTIQKNMATPSRTTFARGSASWRRFTRDS